MTKHYTEFAHHHTTTYNRIDQMNHIQCAALFVLCATLSPAAWSHRPLATDDASTTDRRTCQIEGWQQRAPTEKFLVVAPACGLAAGLELGINFTHPIASPSAARSADIALKWLPQRGDGHWWSGSTPVGEMTAGFKFSAAYARPPGQSWQRQDITALFLLSTTVNDVLSVHTNLGVTRNHLQRINGGLLNLALVATPSERVLLFVESQTNNRRAALGPTLNSLGGRWWVVKERFSVDITASRTSSSQSGVPSGTTYTMGFGWYNLAL